MPLLRHLTLATAVLAISACAGRTPAPVAIVQGHDGVLDCNAISAESTSNNTKIGDLGREDGSKVGQNVAMGTLGVFVPVLWFGMDFQDAPGKEGKALRDRNGYLATLAAQRCAPAVATPYATMSPRTQAPQPVMRGAFPDRIGLSPYPAPSQVSYQR